MNLSRVAYICFDVVPSPKGASTHIEAFAKALVAHTANLHLVTVSPTPHPIQSSQWQGVMHIALPALGKTLIDRVLFFRHQLRHWLQEQWFEAIHIRSIYEGFPIALQKSQYCRFLIFEVNGLPSIELKYRYPQVADDRELMQKITAQEQLCLEAADLVITPSRVTAGYLMQRGVAAAKIRVIANGVDLATFTYHPPRRDLLLSPLHCLYFGTLASWQGVTGAIEAVHLYNRDHPAELTILGTARPDQLAELHKQIRKLDLSHAVHLPDPVSQPELVNYMHHADVILAPLTATDRNLIQGCCPLKVLEGMASGTPVITSDLPVVRELGEPERHFLAVRPGSAKAIKDAMLQLQNEATLRQTLSTQARTQIETHYTWTRAAKELIQAYDSFGTE